jgi:RHS repeat-associated protein
MRSNNLCEEGLALRIAIEIMMLALFLMGVVGAAMITLDESESALDIYFTNPTPENGAFLAQNYAYINTTVSYASTAFIDWNRSLVGWWRFNKESGENATFFRDWSSRRNNAKCSGTNCPKIATSGKFGNALSFDGVNDYLDAGKKSNLNVKSAITIEAWINPAVAQEKCWDGVSGNYGVLSKVGGPANSANWSWQLRYGAPDGCNLGFQFNGNPEGIKWVTFKKNLKAGQWYHIVGTFNGKEIKSYLNGKLKDTNKISSIKGYQNKLLIGNDGWANYFNGKIDDVRIHRRALSSKEIKASYDASMYRLHRNFTNLANGDYNYRAYVQNLQGNINQTEKRTLHLIPSEFLLIPGIPSNLDNTTGTFWANHTWSAGANTDSFNVSVNGNWNNSSNAIFRNTTSSAHSWVNITVAGYNSASHLLSGFISQDTRIPNNLISIKDIQDSYSLNEGQTLTIDANYTDADGDPGTFTRNFSQGTFDTSTGILSWTTGAGDAGVHSWQINVTDRYGSVSTKEFTVNVVVGISPLGIISFAPPSPANNVEGDTRIFNITANQTVNITWYINGTEVFNQSGITESFYTNTSAAAGIWIVNATANNSNGTVSKEWIWNVTAIILPPDPSTVAPQLDLSVATNIATATEFLYTGSNPIQTGMAPGIIEAKRVAVLRGRVMNREGAPISGVSVNILSHPEFGSTVTRADGMFDMAVNGGEPLTVNYEKAGYLTVQRQVHTPWQDYEWLPDVVMIQVDTQVTSIDLSSSEPIQVARGSQVIDIDGTRQATLLFPQGIQATMTLPDGTMQPLTSGIHVRATEYTVGDSGPKAMPSELPPTSGYTYAVEFSVDEATGATDVRFDRPVYTYVENFLNFPVGGIVPVGYYNRSLGQWIPSDNGRIIKILSVTGGMADLDVDGSGQAANAPKLEALSINDVERQKLAVLYQPGQSLWRVPITHFTPWDCNWAYGPPPDATSPKQPAPDELSPDNPDCVGGSIIGCQNQVLGEVVNIADTTFSLHYQSDRVPGRKEPKTLKIPLSGASVPASLKNIILEVFVAGRSYTYGFPAAPNQIKTFTWDGKDAYGRILQGIQPIDVRIGYVYDAVYLTPAQFGPAFGAFGNSLTGIRARQEIIIWQDWKGEIGGIWDARGQGLGGWSLNVNHAYDTSGRILYLGDGRKRSAQNLNQVITTVAGTGIPGFNGDGGQATQAQLYRSNGVAIGSDGSLYIADGSNDRVRRVRPDGNITTVAGTGFCCFNGDGIPATQARLNNPTDVAIGADGSLYIADSHNCIVRRVGPDGIINTVAGAGMRGFRGDGGPATQAYLDIPMGVAIGSDGSLYIADSYNLRIRRMGPDGIITTVAGTGNQGTFNGDGIPATQAPIMYPHGVAIGSDGSLYIADNFNSRVRRVGPDGIINTVAGNGIRGYVGDGGQATQAQINGPMKIAIGSDGSLYIADTYNNHIRRIGSDGIINTVAGSTGVYGFNGDGIPATQAQLNYPLGIAIGSDESLYIADTYNNRVRRVAPALPGFSLADFLIPSDDGSELYIFNNAGRHLRTLDALTGAVRYNFTYDNAGKLNAVTDSDGNIVTIERDATGNATTIVSPYSQRTSLTLNANGYLDSITNPKGESVQLAYIADGLLISMTDPKGSIYRFSYDSLGRLIKDEDSEGGFKVLERTEITKGYSVKLSTGLNRNTTYQVEQLSTGDQRSVNIFPGGLKTETIIGTNGSETSNYPDGTSIALVEGADPRFGMQAPVTKSMTVTTPGGLKGNFISDRTAVLTNPDDLLSLKTLTETTSINGRTFTSTFDAASRKITSQTPMGRKTITNLNTKGRMVESQVPGIIPVNFTYDTLGHLSDIVQGTRAYALRYDAQGNLANITDPLSRTAGFEYDPAGRITRQTLPDGRQIQYTYDAGGNVISITPPGRPDHAFDYTPVDLIKDYTPPDIGIGPTSTSYTYNIDRQLTRVTRPDGAAIDLGYDGAGRLNTINYSQGTTTVDYDPATGNLKNITTPDGGKITYAYDGSLLTDTTWSGIISGSVHRTYDNNFKVTSESVNGNAVNLQYDADGLLTNAGELALSRDPQSGILTASALGTITDTLGYNSFGELAAYNAASSGSGIFAINYTRDDLGRIIEKNETIDGITDSYVYMYDQAGRLTNVRKDDVQVSQYVYDANGNRLSYTGPGGTISGTYDGQDRLLQYGTTTYSYTTNGELLSKTNDGQTTTYQYDVLGNLRNVTLPDGTKIEYIIDGQNRRVGKKVNGILVQGFLYRDGLRPIAELDGAGNVVSRFIYTDSNVPDYMIKGASTYRIITDQLGGPRLVVDINTGAFAQRLDYDEFGSITTETTPGFQPFGFAGGLYDTNTKLTHFGARDYDASTGRWTVKDPILFAGRNTNLYGYVLNDPINRLDPLGLWEVVLPGDDINVKRELGFKSPEDECVVSAHGNKKGVYENDSPVSAKDLAKRINKIPRCREAKVIRLISCYTAGPYAKDLAGWSRKMVIAPTGNVWVDPDGKFGLRENSEWKPHKSKPPNPPFPKPDYPLPSW